MDRPPGFGARGRLGFGLERGEAIKLLVPDVRPARRRSPGLAEGADRADRGMGSTDMLRELSHRCLASLGISVAANAWLRGVHAQELGGMDRSAGKAVR
jgi:hypothetical protein